MDVAAAKDKNQVGRYHAALTNRKQPFPGHVFVENREQWADKETNDRRNYPNDPEMTGFADNELIQIEQDSIGNNIGARIHQVCQCWPHDLVVMENR